MIPQKQIIKKGGIASLQPAALASFRTWGNSRGADRTASAKILPFTYIINRNLKNRAHFIIFVPCAFAPRT